MTATASRPEADASNDVERWLRDQRRSGRLKPLSLDRLRAVAVIIATPNGNGNGAVRLVSATATAPAKPRSVLARVTSDEKRHLARKLDLRRPAVD